MREKEIYYKYVFSKVTYLGVSMNFLLMNIKCRTLKNLKKCIVIK